MKKLTAWVKDITVRLATNVIEKLSISDDIQSRTPFTIIPLTPIDNAEITGYDTALDDAFKSRKIKNIALSGAYGAGKSSVINTYERKYEKPFLHISLAHFAPNDEQNEGIGNTARLEWKILNQLIHQINPRYIPQTNFGVKKNYGKWRILFSAIAVVLISLLLLYIFMFNKWCAFCGSLSWPFIEKILEFTVYPETRVFAFVICSIIVSIAIFSLLKLQRNRHVVKKIDIKGTEIQMFDSGENSYFDKYLNEVLYLFENAKNDVIVFEDMDRFENIEIFERLREVNTLVNASRKLKQPVIKFVYLIRNDIFDNKDRTKFFDVIIPVVP